MVTFHFSLATGKALPWAWKAKGLRTGQRQGSSSRMWATQLQSGQYSWLLRVMVKFVCQFDGAPGYPGVCTGIILGVSVRGLWLRLTFKTVDPSNWTLPSRMGVGLVQSVEGLHATQGLTIPEQKGTLQQTASAPPALLGSPGVAFRLELEHPVFLPTLWTWDLPVSISCEPGP